MTDSIEDSDVRRVDENVDPTALTASEIEEQLPDDFSSSAKREFSDRVASERTAVQESVDLSQRFSPNPASGEQQLRGSDGRFGPMASEVEGARLEDDGQYVAEVDSSSDWAQEHGTEFVIDEVDLDAGAGSRREANW